MQISSLDKGPHAHQCGHEENTSIQSMSCLILLSEAKSRYVGVYRRKLGVCADQQSRSRRLCVDVGKTLSGMSEYVGRLIWTTTNWRRHAVVPSKNIPWCITLFWLCVLWYVTGSEYNSIHGGARSEDVQRPAVCERHREPHENSGRQTEDRLWKSTQPQPQEFSGAFPHTMPTLTTPMFSSDPRQWLSKKKNLQ